MTGPVPKEHLAIVPTWPAGGVVVFALAGDLDAHSSTGLRSQLEALARAGSRHVILDLGGLAFFDSSGLGVFVAAHKSACARQGTFGLVTARQHFLKTLARTGLDQVLAIYPDVDSAVEALTCHTEQSTTHGA